MPFCPLNNLSTMVTACLTQAKLVIVLLESKEKAVRKRSPFLTFAAILQNHHWLMVHYNHICCHTTKALLPHYKCLVATLQASCCHATKALQPHCKHLVATLQKPCRHSTSILQPQYKWHCTDKRGANWLKNEAIKLIALDYIAMRNCICMRPELESVAFFL